VPATVAILGGRLKAGLSLDQITYLGRAGEGAVKCSRRDLPFVVAAKKDGATTVAATMIVARMAGIPLFVTGGIGGVHRGGAESFDISADLQELARTPVAVVSAGIKSILDIGLTLEYLETRGVPVTAYQTRELPAFFTRHSGFFLDHSVDSPAEAAALMKAQWDLGLGGGILIANPIPPESSYPKEEIDRIIAAAVAEAAKEGITGKAITPFLLARVSEISGGRSLEANISLVLHNAELGARIACAYAGTALQDGE
jgi:pseudouridine-5'-phosphate glycosidase